MANVPSDPRLAWWPRPEGDNGIGMHAGLQGSKSLDMVPVYKDKHIKWATVYNNDQNEIIKLATALRDQAGTMSVLRLDIRKASGKPRPPGDFVGAPNALTDMAIAAKLPPYIQINNEGDVNANWMAYAAPIVKAGGYAGLQLLDPPDIIQAAQQLAANPGVAAKTFFCLHNAGLNRPPDFDPHKSLYCAQRFLVYEEIFMQYLGFVPPMIATESGWDLGDTNDATFGPLTIEQWIDYHIKQFNWFKTGKLTTGKPTPDYLFAINPFLIYDGGWYADSWINGLQSDQAHADSHFTLGRFKSEVLGWMANNGDYIRQFQDTVTQPPAPPPAPPPQPPPPVPPLPTPSASKLGIHVPNVGTLLGQPDFYSTPWTNFVVLHLNKGYVPDLRAHYPNALIVMRAYLQNWYNQDPIAWAQQIASLANELKPYTVDWTFANEQNLSGEGHPNGAPFNGTPYPPAQVYTDINNWNLKVIAELRRDAPFVRIHFPALSQGHSDDQNDAGYVGFELCRASVESCDVLDVHTYWNVGNPDGSVDSPYYGKRYEKLHALFPNKPLFISEYGGTFPNTPGAADEYKHWLDTLPDYITGAAAFIWDSDAPNAAWRIYNQPALVSMFKNYTAPSAPPPQPEPSHVPLSDAALAQLVVSQGFPQPDVAMAIILAESGGDPNATNTLGNTPPSTDRGLWQFNSHWHPEVSDTCAFDPVCATKAAFKVSAGGTDFHQWSSFKAGTHTKFLARAQAAIAALNPAPPPPPVPSDLKIDPRISWLIVNQGQSYRVREVWFYDDKPPDDPESEDGIDVIVVVRDANGHDLYHEAVKQEWPDGSSIHYTKEGGATRHQMSGDSNFDPKRGERGPYTFSVGDCWVRGLGLPLKQHVLYLILVVKL